MRMPKSFQQKGDHKVCSLLKSLYGLKQASKQWNIKLTSALLATIFIQSAHDYSLFTLKGTTRMVVVLVYIDYLLIHSDNEDMILEAKDILHKQFQVKDLGNLKYFLGIELLRSSQVVILNQRKYLLELILEVGMAVRNHLILLQSPMLD